MTALLVVACVCNAAAMVSFNEVKENFKPSDTLILDRNGAFLHRLRTDKSVRRGQWIALEDVSPALHTALVLSEDKRFYEHSGVDWLAVSAAAWGNMWHTKTRGASTITMQLAGLLDKDLKRSVTGRSVMQKIDQVVSAQMLERSWRKDQILEAYLNLVPFRGELVGIDALSQTMFGKAAHGLDQREAAIAASLVRAPSTRPTQLVQRACSVLHAMEAISLKSETGTRTSMICEGLDAWVAGALQRKAFDTSEGIAPHVARQVISVLAEPVDAPHAHNTVTGSVRPSVVQTTLHAPLQRFAVQTLQHHLRELQARHVEDGAIVVLDNASGEVLAWVGSSGELSMAADVDGVTALRQPGSALKPFLYAQAIAERRMTAASLLEDASTHIQTAGGLYIPQNYDHQFKGWVSARTALGASLNLPAVRTLMMVSPDAFQKQLVSLGLPLKEGGDYYGFSLALGSADVSLLNLTNAYRTLGNGGRYSATSLTVKLQPSMRLVIDPRAAFIVGDILSDPMARARTFGTDSVLATRFWTAVKTGTSKDMRDNWALGFSQLYTVGVWVGNASGAPMWDVSGTTGAAPIWAAVMNYLHKTKPSHAPKAPPGLVQVPVRFSIDTEKTPIEAARTEWFLQGTQQSTFAMNTKDGGAANKRTRKSYGFAHAPIHHARILAPPNGTIIALDPDIPRKHQLVALIAEGSDVGWKMDGKAFAKGASAQWMPWPGHHVLQLTGAKDETMDEILLEVRGAAVKESESFLPIKAHVR